MSGAAGTVGPGGRSADAAAPLDLLYVTEEVPNRDPLHGNGSSLIPYEVVRALPPGVRVVLVTFDGDFPVPQEVADRCADVVLLRRRSEASALARSVRGGVSVGGAARATREAEGVVRRLSAAADVTLLHGPHVTPLAAAVVGPLVIQVVDPWSRRLAMDAGLAHGWRARYRFRQADAALRWERRLPSRAHLLTVGQADAAAWSAALGRPVSSIANGVEAAGHRWSPPPVPTISFVGSLSYDPNIESAEVLVRDLGPRVWAEVPSARIVLAGREPGPRVLDLASPRVEVRANVPSVAEVFLASSVAVFADRRGLGVRNSVTEALACGVPVVASPAAAREQPPNPRLQVGVTDEELAALAVAALRSDQAVPDPGGEGPGARTWSEVAAEYLACCRSATAAAGRD